MQFFKTALAFSSMAALTLTDTGTAKSVDNVLGIGMITPDKGGNDVLMVFHPPASRTVPIIIFDSGDEVSYDLSNDGKGMAVNVKLVEYKKMLISDGD